MVKAALNLLDFPVGGLRLPLVEATDQQISELNQIMKEVLNGRETKL
jgi:4-hydroxy-tetrahydrodipicolinate synthase